MRSRLFRNRPIGTAFTLWTAAGLLVAVTLLARFAFDLVRTENEAASEAKGALRLRDQTERVRVQIAHARSNLLALARSLAVLSPDDGTNDAGLVDSETLDSVLRSTLAEEPRLLGVFLVREPTSDDRTAVDQMAPTDPVTYWRRAEEQVVRRARISEHPAPLVPEYYDHVRNFRTDVVIDGLSRNIDGRSQLFMTLLAPVVSEGKFRGVAGVDLDLDVLQEIVDNFNEGGRHILFLAGTGQIIAGTAFDNGGEPEAESSHVLCAEQIAVGGGVKPWQVVAYFPQSGTSLYATSTLRGVASIVLIHVVAILVLWYFVWRRIIAPLRATTTLLQEIAQGPGDLTRRLDIDFTSEVSPLATWFNAFVTRVHNLVQTTTSSAGEVAASAAQVAASSQQLSAAIAKVASQSQEASDDAVNTGHVAEQGEKVVSQTIDGIHAINRAVKDTSSTIEDLSRHSTQIHGIITTIHTVAQQTNLLALNATIEAARAGEAGRGFAVVADEVKQLARQTTDATKDIEQCLHAIHSKTDLAVEQMARGSEHANSGVENARLTSASLERIVFGTRQFTNITSSISSITDEAKKAGQLAATAAEELAQKALKLQNQVGKIKL